MLDLSEFFVLTLQLLLVDSITLHLCQCALVVEVVHCTVNFRVEVMVVLEEFELTRCVSAEGSGRWEWGGLEGFNVLVGVPIDHAVDEGVFSILEFDVFCWLHFPTGEANVEGNIVRTFVQHVPLWDLRSWSIIFPSSPCINVMLL